MEKTHWIKLSESLPLDGQDVFVLVWYKGMFQFHHDRFYAGRGVWLFGDSPVVAWIPIPDYTECIKDLML